MAIKHKTLYLFLTLACFVGITLIFIFDGYMGVYDTLVMDNGQYPQKVEADQWDTERYGGLASMNVERGGRIEFTYSVANHRFSAYKADVQTSLYFQQEKVADVYTGTIEAAAFKDGTIDWTVDAAEIIPANYPAEQPYNAYLLLKRGKIDHRINIYINPSAYQIKTITVPPAP
jgi:hypothetical protein